MATLLSQRTWGDDLHRVDTTVDDSGRLELTVTQVGQVARYTLSSDETRSFHAELTDDLRSRPNARKMMEELERVESDERLSYPCANVLVNGPLAIEQISAKSQAAALRWALGLPPGKYHGEE